MIQNIPIKVKKSSLSLQKKEQFRVKLNHDIRKPESHSFSAGKKRKLVDMGIGLVIGAVICSALFFAKSLIFPAQIKKPWLFLPEGAGLYASINIRESEEKFLKNLTSQHLPVPQDLQSILNQFLGETNIILDSDILKKFNEIFEEEINLSFSNEESDSPFVLILKNKATLELVEEYLNQIERVLKPYFNFSSKIYRETYIVSLTPFNSPSQETSNIYYSLKKNYLILSNNLLKIQEVIDKILEQG